MSIRADIQKLSPSAIIELFEIDATNMGGSIYRFHTGKNGLLSDIVWNGQTYNAFPIEASGFEWNGKGQLPRPKVMVSNVLGSITALVLAYQDLIGCKFTRIRTLAKYLDAVNFPARRNLLSSTDSFSSWGVVTASPVITGGQADPFGGSIATLLNDTSTLSDGAALEKSVSPLVPSGSTSYRSSIYLKQGTALYSDLYVFFTGVSTKGSLVRFTYGTGLASGSSADGGGAVPTSLSVKALPDGWFRISWTLVDALGSNTSALWRVYPAGRDAGVTGSAYVYGPQFEIGTGETDYQVIGSTWSRNPTADPTAEFARDIYYVDRKSNETRDYVEFELAAAVDLAGVSLPRRQIVQNYCPWQYRGAECGYTDSSYFDANDAAVGSSVQDVCGKRLKSCRLRFGQTAELPYGGFPAAGLVRA